MKIDKKEIVFDLRRNRDGLYIQGIKDVGIIVYEKRDDKQLNLAEEVMEKILNN